MTALYQRLSVLFQLDLSCTLYFKTPGTPWGYRALINQCEYRDGRLILSGDHFSVNFSEDRIDAFCVMSRLGSDKPRKIVELRDKEGGQVRARILGLPANRGTEVWQDIMDTFVLAAAENEPLGSRSMGEVREMPALAVAVS